MNKYNSSNQPSNSAHRQNNNDYSGHNWNHSPGPGGHNYSRHRWNNEAQNHTSNNGNGHSTHNPPGGYNSDPPRGNGNQFPPNSPPPYHHSHNQNNYPGPGPGGYNSGFNSDPPRGNGNQFPPNSPPPYHHSHNQNNSPGPGPGGYNSGFNSDPPRGNGNQFPPNSPPPRPHSRNNEALDHTPNNGNQYSRYGLTPPPHFTNNEGSCSGDQQRWSPPSPSYSDNGSYQDQRAVAKRDSAKLRQRKCRGKRKEKVLTLEKQNEELEKKNAKLMDKERIFLVKNDATSWSSHVMSLEAAAATQDPTNTLIRYRDRVEDRHDRARGEDRKDDLQNRDENRKDIEHNTILDHRFGSDTSFRGTKRLRTEDGHHQLPSLGCGCQAELALDAMRLGEILSNLRNHLNSQPRNPLITDAIKSAASMLWYSVRHDRNSAAHEDLIRDQEKLENTMAGIFSFIESIKHLNQLQKVELKRFLREANTTTTEEERNRNFDQQRDKKSVDIFANNLSLIKKNETLEADLEEERNAKGKAVPETGFFKARFNHNEAEKKRVECRLEERLADTQAEKSRLEERFAYTRAEKKRVEDRSEAEKSRLEEQLADTQADKNRAEQNLALTEILVKNHFTHNTRLHHRRHNRKSYP